MNSYFKLDSKGLVNNVLKADWMLEHMKEVADKKTDGEHHTKPFIGFDRAKVIIYPNTKGHSK